MFGNDRHIRLSAQKTEFKNEWCVFGACQWSYFRHSRSAIDAEWIDRGSIENGSGDLFGSGGDLWKSDVENSRKNHDCRKCGSGARSDGAAAG